MSVVRAVMLICVIFALVNSVSANNSTGVIIHVTTLPLPTVSSGSGGSGGGGVITSEDPKNINNFESKDGDLHAGQETRYSFNKVGAGIFYAIVTGKENENDVTIRAENLKGRSSRATSPAPNTIYIYTNILSGSQRIEKARIGFKVPNTWLDSNKIDRSTVKMYRLQVGQWNVLDTKQTGNDAENTIYEASTTGFSSFAIAGQIIAAPTVAPTVAPIPQATTASATVTPAIPVETPKTQGFSSIFGLIALILVIYKIRKGRQ